MIEQQTHDWRGRAFDLNAALPNARIIKVPVALMSCLWPFAYDDPRDNGSPQRNLFSASLCDSLVAKLVKQGCSLETIYDDYMAVDIRTVVNLDRLYKHNKAKLQQIDQWSSFAIWPYIEDHLSRAKTFRLTNHPNGNLMAFLIESALSEICEDHKNFACHVEQIKGGFGIQPTEAPIHPAVREHFDLTWDTGKYRSFDRGYISHREFIEMVFLLKWDDRIDQANALFAKGDVDGAIRLLDGFITSHKENHIGYQVKGSLLVQAKRYDEAAPLLLRAFDLAPNSTAGNMIIRSLMALNRDPSGFLETWREKLGGDAVEYQLALYDTLIDKQRDAANAILRRLIEAGCQEALPWYLLANAELRSDNIDAARRCLKQAAYLGAGSKIAERAANDLARIEASGVC